MINKKVLVVFGTRPEAIKMCPLVIELKKHQEFRTFFCVTGQHKEMLQQVLDIFHLEPDFQLDVMKKGQTLIELSSKIETEISIVMENIAPDLVLVHGDTTTSFATALASFYLRIPIGHVEAGLRTYNHDSPFPEEFNRQAIGAMATLHFAPTMNAVNNLIMEGKEKKTIFLTGNTGIDALKYTINENYSHPLQDWIGTSRFVLLTAHRRENIGTPMVNMFRAIKRVVTENPDIKVIYPIHYNPIVREIAYKELGGVQNIKLIDPLNVYDFHNLIKLSYLILTDSGGIQEEAPSLGKPVLVMRDTTERPEGVQAGTLKLVGIEEDSVYTHFTSLIRNKDEYEKMSHASNPYGTGDSCEIIAEIISNYLSNREGE